MSTTGRTGISQADAPQAGQRAARPDLEQWKQELKSFLAEARAELNTFVQVVQQVETQALMRQGGQQRPPLPRQDQPTIPDRGLPQGAPAATETSHPPATVPPKTMRTTADLPLVTAASAQISTATDRLPRPNDPLEDAVRSDPESVDPAPDFAAQLNAADVESATPNAAPIGAASDEAVQYTDLQDTDLQDTDLQDTDLQDTDLQDSEVQPSAVRPGVVQDEDLASDEVSSGHADANDDAVEVDVEQAGQAVERWTADVWPERGSYPPPVADDDDLGGLLSNFASLKPQQHHLLDALVAGEGATGNSAPTVAGSNGRNGSKAEDEPAKRSEQTQGSEPSQRNHNGSTRPWWTY